MHRIRIITLDLDDTLWPIMPVIRRAESTMWRWLAEHYPKIPVDWDAERAATLREEVVAEHAAKAHDLKFLRRTVLARMAEASGYGTEPVDPAFDVFDEQRNTVELFPDAEAALRRLGSNYRLLALTNGNADLEKIGIRHFFHDVITAVNAGAAKPSRQIFDVACDRAGVSPDEVLHVGDHPEIDIRGAQQAGMRTAWVNRRGEEWPAEWPDPDATVETMHELADWLDSFNARRKSDSGTT